MSQLSIGLCLALLHQSVGGGTQLPPVPRPRMNIVALEGEGTIHHIRKRQPRNIVVQVRDGNRNPIAGATVHFTAPVQGPSGEFPNGSKTLTVTSDAEGHAAARGFRPNSAAGKIELRVDASHNQETASLVVTQFSMAVSGGGGSGKWIALIGIVGGAAAGGAYAAMRTSSPASPASAAASVITINPGTGTVGRPR